MTCVQCLNQGSTDIICVECKEINSRFIRSSMKFEKIKAKRDLSFRQKETLSELAEELQNLIEVYKVRSSSGGHVPSHVSHVKQLLEEN